MNLNDWLTIIATLGGFETIKWTITFFVNRKINTRKEEATVESMEDESQRKQVDWLEKRLSERDAKIDTLYGELRHEQSTHLDEIHKKHEIELKLKEAEMKRCDVRSCGDRRPPSEY